MGEYVNQKSLALMGLVVLSVAAIAMSAATVANVETAGGGDGGSPLSPINDGGGGGAVPNDSGGQSDEVIDTGGDNDNEQLQLRGCNELLSSIPGSIGYFAALAGILYLIRRRTSLGFSLLAAYAVTPIFLTVYFLRTQCGDGGVGISDQEAPGTTNGTGPSSVGPDIPPTILVGGFVVLFVGVAAVLYISSGSREYVQEEPEEESEEADVADIAAAAAEAAERLEARDADVDNEVYRAWWEMTQLLNVSSPETYTPGQFAEAAIDLGIGEEHVDDLTTLFEEVRYGHRDPEAREQRAIDVFRQIEQYGEDAAESPAGDDDATEGEQ